MDPSMIGTGIAVSAKRPNALSVVVFSCLSEVWVSVPEFNSASLATCTVAPLEPCGSQQPNLQHVRPDSLASQGNRALVAKSMQIGLA